jgi:hypothetical protein
MIGILLSLIKVLMGDSRSVLVFDAAVSLYTSQTSPLEPSYLLSSLINRYSPLAA